MPREMKGRSPQFQPSKERVPIGSALDKLYILFQGWALTSNDYVLVDEFAFVLQGYEVYGKEIEDGHLDVLVNSSSLPWEHSKERSVIPPKSSRWLDEYSSYMTETKYGLDMLASKPDFLKLPTEIYYLPSGNSIRLMKPYEMTELWINQTLMRDSLKDVDIDKIKEWFNKLNLIKEAALKKDDKELEELSSKKIMEVKERWKGII